jgi:malonyl-CoA O-methyltransferase
LKSRIRNAFDRASRSYEKWAVVQRDVAHDCAKLVAPGSYDTVLEIGSGAGFLTALLAPRIDARLYLALDLAPGMVKKAVYSSLSGVVPLVGDGENPPLAPGRVDLLVSSSALQWYLNPEESIPRNLALLRPGGWFALALFVQGTLAELEEVSASTGFGSAFPLRPARDYERIMSQIRGISWESRKSARIMHYDCVATFLRAHQGTGAKATPRMGKVGRQRYARFSREYSERFKDREGIRATYEILYLSGKKL